VIGRIAILGGSSVYIPEFVLSLISHNLNFREIVLIGQPGRKLGIVTEFCQRLLDKSGFPATVHGTTDVAEGVSGAKYVLNHVRVGGMQARLRDEKLPVKFEMVGDESLGAGGFANALRTLPVVLEHARIIQECNPNAVLINLTNPIGVVIEALVKYTKLTVVGVCDLPGKYIKMIAGVLHTDVDEMWGDYIGLNHMGWIQDVKVHGRSCMSQLLEKLERHRDEGFDHELIELFRMIPTRQVGLYFHRQDILKQQQKCARFRAEVLQEAEKRILELYENKSLCEIPELTRERNAVWYEETISPLIAALESPKERDVILCVRNGGSIRDLPEDCSVEIPVRVSRRGLKPYKAGSCPRFLKGLFLAVKESNRLAVEAVQHHSYEAALQALAINPLVPSLHSAKRFLDNLCKEENIRLH